MKTMIGSLIVLPENEHIYSERATTVRLEDEGAGCFVEVEQCGRNGNMKIGINPDEWPALREAIDRIFEEAKK
jgi:hypothetical protein